MSKWIRKNDKVVVITGNDKGKVGNVILRRAKTVVVQGVNVRKKHIKRSQKSQGAQILDMEMPINISNVSLCDEENKPVSIKVKANKDKKELIYFSQGKEVVVRSLKK
ncbi:MAG: 50S ribosomal protein L24 [Chlamydiae bacterium]|nr:50S ribosomal protein L24 [Chlamydiota bacterium]